MGHIGSSRLGETWAALLTREQVTWSSECWVEFQVKVKESLSISEFCWLSVSELNLEKTKSGVWVVLNPSNLENSSKQDCNWIESWATGSLFSLTSGSLFFPTSGFLLFYSTPPSCFPTWRSDKTHTKPQSFANNIESFLFSWQTLNKKKKLRIQNFEKSSKRYIKKFSKIVKNYKNIDFILISRKNK